METRLLDLLVCPVCKGPLDHLRPPIQDETELVCRADGLAFPVRDGIPVMLENEARSLDAAPPAAGPFSRPDVSESDVSTSDVATTDFPSSVPPAPPPPPLPPAPTSSSRSAGPAFSGPASLVSGVAPATGPRDATSPVVP